MIVCKYKNQNRIFINHRGNVIPCCYLNAEMLEYSAGRRLNSEFTDILNENGGELSVNMNYNTIREAMEGDTWADIVASWDNKPLTKCYVTCNLMDRDTFEDELL